MSAVGLRETLWSAAWFGREVVVTGDSPQEMWVLTRERSLMQCDGTRAGCVCHRGYCFLRSEVSYHWVIMSSILKFSQVSPNGFLSSMTHQRPLFEPILNLGAWQMVLSIPWSVCIQFIVSCSFYTARSSNSWSSHVLYTNTSVGKKKRHILEGGTFGDQITKSILWQKIQKH